MTESAPARSGSTTGQVAVALIGAVASIAIAWFTASAQARSTTDNRLEEKSASVQSITARIDQANQQSTALAAKLGDILHRTESLQHDVGELGGVVRSPQKMCSAVVANQWRDTIVVPAEWAPDQCRQFMVSVGAGTWQLGCVSAAQFSWGGPGGGIPPQNSCKW